METLSIKVEKREKHGKQASKQMRKKGFIPGVIYGHGIEPIKITIPEKDLSVLIAERKKKKFLLDITIKESEEIPIKSILYDLQYNVITGVPLHVDFYHISMDENITTSVPIILNGESPGVVTNSGILDFVLREVEIECLPAEIPDNIMLDISNMDIGDKIHVSDLTPGNFTILTDTDRLIVAVHPPKITKVVEEVKPEVAEPEVIGKGAAEEKAKETKDKGDKGVKMGQGMIVEESKK